MGRFEVFAARNFSAWIGDAISEPVDFFLRIPGCASWYRDQGDTTMLFDTTYKGHIPSDFSMLERRVEGALSSIGR